VPFPEVFVEVKTPPVANFEWTPTEPHASGIVTFDASASYDPDGGSIVSYNWSGSFEGSGETVTHVFGTEGNYSVTLTVTDDEGKTAEVSKEVTVISKPPGITITPPNDKGPYIGQQITIGLNFTNGVGKNASLTVDDECTIWSVESLPSNETNVTWIPMSSGEHTIRAYLNGTEYDNAPVPIYIRKIE
jgi:PKD repeat protein